MTKKQILIMTLVGISFLSNLSSLFAQSPEWSESKRKKGIQYLLVLLQVPTLMSF